MWGDEDIAELADDPDLAFVQFERMARARLDSRLEGLDPNVDTSIIYFEYMSAVLAAAKSFQISDLAKWRLPSMRDDDVERTCQDFAINAQHVAMQIQLRFGPRFRTSSVKIGQNAREKLRHHLAQMREAVEKSELSQEKKDRIMRRINDLQKEVDAGRTPIQSLGELVMQISDITSNAIDRVLPSVRAIAAIFQSERETEEAERAQLPKPIERKRIKGPEQSDVKPANGTAQKGFEDDIPF